MPQPQSGVDLGVVEEGEGRLCIVLRLDEDELVPLEIVDDAVVIPSGYHALQVQVRCEEANHSCHNSNVSKEQGVGIDFS